MIRKIFVFSKIFNSREQSLTVLNIINLIEEYFSNSYLKTERQMTSASCLALLMDFYIVSNCICVGPCNTFQSIFVFFTQLSLRTAEERIEVPTIIAT